MFDINFIAEPGIQNGTSDASWSFLYKKSEQEMNEKFDSQQLKASFIHQNSWLNYFFVLIILGFIVVISIINISYTHFKPDLVLNQVIDLIVESSYLINLQLEEANFSKDQVKITIRSEDFTTIQSISHDYHMDEIPYEIYQKDEYSYLNLIFPWKGNVRAGNIQTLQSLANKTVFSNKISIISTEDKFEIQGKSSDIISFLLQMAENNQIEKFNFSVFHHESGQFNLIVQ